MPIRSWFALFATFVCASAGAAGGHFDVDDANVLEPGHCQVEVWANRAPQGDANGLHFGPSCRLGPVEIGLDLDRVANAANTANAVGPHLKWAHALDERLAIGAVVGTAFDLRRGGHPVQALYAPLTWTPSERWALNLNLGWDRSDEGVTHRAGVSVEWSPNEAWTVIGEHVRTGGATVNRLGARWTIAPGLSVDLSAARAGAFTGRLYTIGINRDFER